MGRPGAYPPGMGTWRGYVTRFPSFARLSEVIGVVSALILVRKGCFQKNSHGPPDRCVSVCGAMSTGCCGQCNTFADLSEHFF